MDDYKVVSIEYTRGSHNEFGAQMEKNECRVTVWFDDPDIEFVPDEIAEQICTDYFIYAVDIDFRIKSH